MQFYKENAMKAATYTTLVAVLSLSGLNSVANADCSTGGQAPVNQTPAQAPANGGSAGRNPTVEEVRAFLGATNPAPARVAPAGPKVSNAAATRITVVPGDSSAAGLAAKPNNGARITVVPDAPATTKPEPEAPVVADNETLPEELKGLVGNWTTVGRFGDNELTTVELQLDDRGWATLTLPGADGKKATSKRKVELKDKEIKLIGQGAATVLGKVVNVSERQMVLENGSSQVTFVRI